MAITEDALLDRVRAVCVALSFIEATALDLTRTPSGRADKAFTAKLSGTTPVGGTSFTEEGNAAIVLTVSRLILNDYDATRRALLQDARALLKAIVADGAVTSGEYVVADAGRTIDVDPVKGANYLELRLRVPVNFEAALV